ncbi:uracil-DNA glycosylase family 4 [Kineococcus xinjiangensis]|uniref:Type-5 uracil-DNA glycosylase n=1 Tax=Kineococcus xinjiangensis TaxID=512762 RepID=A0A2S6ISJ4_9ACTN|nr:uracil-DNA glycosylase [Kineococcus xinjiangensis]PPK97224.1 uracil-DNA glycosylase family 4 [Kineococcus xinjiangensis]
MTPPPSDDRGGPLLPHPATGVPFPSPVPPGSGWPGDPSPPSAPVARTPAEVAALAAAAGSPEQVQAHASVCRACPRLVAWREEVARTRRRAYAGEPYWGRPVPSLGESPRVLVVGLAPAAHGGNRTGRVFTGDRSGDWIIAALHAAGLASQPTSVHAADGLRLPGCRIVAPVRCAPPDNRPSTAERDTCARWLDAELRLAVAELRVVLALGGFAWASVLGAARRAGWRVPRPQPRFGHGAQAELLLPDGRAARLLGSYHVSQQNTSTGRLTAAMLQDVVSAAAALAEAGD